MPHVLKRELRPDSALTLLRLGLPSRHQEDVEYGPILDRVQARTTDTLAWLAELAERAVELAEELSRLPDGPERRRRVRELARAEPWAVPASLLGMACRRVRRDPVRAGALAELATVAAEEVPDGAELRGRAEALQAEALSRARRFREAEAAFARAVTHLPATAAETPLSLACRLLSRAESDQGPLGDSVARFDRAAARLA